MVAFVKPSLGGASEHCSTLLVSIAVWSVLVELTACDI
jgi:hypothetical protein